MQITVQIPDDLSSAVEELTAKFGSIDKVISHAIREEAARATTAGATLSYNEWKKSLTP